MKKLTKLAFALIILSSTALYVSGQTLKERIDDAKVVKVYFKNSPIAHNPNTTPPLGSNQSGTGCEKFGETTPVPQEYVDAVNGLIDVLNKGFQTTAFVVGDFAAVPLKASGILKGEPDWVVLNEPLIFYVNTSGYYNVKMSSTGRQNSMNIDCYLNIYYLKDGKIKIADQKSLVSKWTEPISSQKCNDYAYFVEKFPAIALVEPFKTDLTANINELIDKDMKKYEEILGKLSLRK